MDNLLFYTRFTAWRVYSCQKRMERNPCLWLQLTVIAVYLIGSGRPYNCRYYAPSVLRPGPQLSAHCNDTTALVSWDLTELNVDLEAVYVEYSCDFINPTNTTEPNNAELTGPVYEVYTPLKVSASSTLAPIEEGYSCRYFGCARQSFEQTWYTFNTVNCIYPTSYALPLTTSNGPVGAVQSTSLTYEHFTSEGISGLLPSTTVATTSSTAKGITTLTSATSASSPSGYLHSATPVNTPVPTTSETPSRGYSGARAWRVPLIAVMTSLIVVGLFLLLVVFIISRKTSRRPISMFGQEKPDLTFNPVQPDVEKMSITSEISVFYKLYASLRDLVTTTDAESTSTASFVLPTHPRCTSESSADDSCQDQIRTPIDTSGGTDGYMETCYDQKPDITVTDLVTPTADGASIALQTSLAEDSKHRQTLSYISTEPRKQEPSDLTISHQLPPRAEYIRYQDEISDDDTVLELPDDIVDIWNIESGSVSGESFVEVEEDDI